MGKIRNTDYRSIPQNTLIRSSMRFWINNRFAWSTKNSQANIEHRTRNDEVLVLTCARFALEHQSSSTCQNFFNINIPEAVSIIIQYLIFLVRYSFSCSIFPFHLVFRTMILIVKSHIWLVLQLCTKIHCRYEI